MGSFHSRARPSICPRGANYDSPVSICQRRHFVLAGRSNAWLPALVSSRLFFYFFFLFFPARHFPRTLRRYFYRSWPVSSHRLYLLTRQRPPARGISVVLRVSLVLHFASLHPPSNSLAPPRTPQTTKFTFRGNGYDPPPAFSSRVSRRRVIFESRNSRFRASIILSGIVPLATQFEGIVVHV